MSTNPSCGCAEIGSEVKMCSGASKSVTSAQEKNSASHLQGAATFVQVTRDGESCTVIYNLYLPR